MSDNECVEWKSKNKQVNSRELNWKEREKREERKGKEMATQETMEKVHWTITVKNSLTG